MNTKIFRVLSIFLLFGSWLTPSVIAQTCSCDIGVTTFIVDLSSTTDSTWTTSSTRSGLCCGATGSTNCIRFEVTVNPGTDEIAFNVANPSPPGGAFYQVDCGPQTSLGTPLCVTGLSTFCITFCKSGGDSPTYTISAAKTFAASPDIQVRGGCGAEISVSGLQQSTITWNSVDPGALGTYNGYLSCTASCDTTTVTLTGAFPVYIDYEVCGTSTGCSSGTSCDTVRVFTAPELLVDITPTNPVVCSPGPGTVTLTANVSGGAPPYTYLWSTGATTPTIDVGPGTYTVDVSDTSSNCPPVTATVTVAAATTPAQPTVTSNSPVCEGDDILLTATSDPGATYSWTGPNGYTSTTQNPTIAAATTAEAGTYTVTPDLNGCVGPSADVTVVVEPIPVAPTAGSNGPLCEGDDLNLTASAIAGATYSWTGPNGFTSSQQNPTITGVTAAEAGTYNVTATVNGCTGPAGTVSVTINATPPALILGSNSPICEGDDLNLTANTVVGGTYSWSGPNGFTSTTEDPIITGATSAAAGTYSATVSVGGCTSPAATTTVVVTPIPLAPTAGSNSPICIGDDLNLTTSAIAGAAFSWTGPNGFTSAQQNPTITGATAAASGTYSVTATVNGCTGPAGTVAVTVAPPPAAPTAGSNSPLCEGDDLNLTASSVAGATYSWTGPNGFTSTNQNPTVFGVTAAESGAYSVSAIVGGCQGPAGSVAVTVSPIPTTPVASSNSPICVGQTINLSTTAVAGATYSWTGPNGFTSAQQNPSITNATTAESGTYSLTLTVNGCTSTAGTVDVTVNNAPPSPTVSSNSPVCEGDDISLTASLVAGATYSWTGPNGFTSTQQNPTITGTTTADAGTYTLVVDNGCPSTPVNTSATVNATPAALTLGSNSPICEGDDLNLTANTVAGGTYSWSGPNGFTSTQEDPIIGGATVSASGTYSATVTAGGCPSPVATVSVTINPVPTAPTAGANSPVCEGDDIALTASLIAGATYSWTGPNGFASTNQNPTITVATNAEAGTYSVTVIAAGCTSPASDVSVTVNATPAAPTATSNSPICEGDDLNLSATNIAGATYSWTGPNGFTSTNQNPTIFGVTAAESGAYSVTANVAGCPSAAATTAVTVNPIPATPVPSSNSPICIGQTINLSNAAVVGAAYNWTGPNGFTSSIQSPSITNATATEAGTYSLTVTVNGCTSSAGTVTVAVNTAPGTPTAGSNSPLCVGDDLNLTSSTIAGATYSWTGPNGFTSTQQNPTVTGITAAGAGTYTVIADNGCASSPADVSVTVNPTPAALTLGSNSPICEGDDILLDANTIAGGTYDWTGPNGVTSSQEDPIVNGATTADGGVYSATVTVNGCMSVPATTTVTVNPIPAAPSIGSNSPVCEFYDLNLDAGTVPGATYNWTGPNGFTSALEDPTITGITSAGAGAYNVTITVLGCESTPASTSVTVEPTPATPTASSNSPICEGGQLDLSASNVVGTTYDWTGPNGYSSSQQNPSINPVSAADAGIYSVTATSTTNGCVSFPGTVNVTILAIPSSPGITSNSPVCIGDDITLLTTAVAGATYNWTGPNGFTSAMQNPTITGSTLADAGFYYLTIEVNGCISNTDSIEVFVNDQPVTPVASNNGPICEFETLEIFVDTIPGAVYSWIGPNGFTSTDQNPSIPLATAGEAGTYTVIADNGCSSNPASTSVTINPSPGTPVVGSNSPVCVGDDIDLTASTVGGSTFTWTGPNGYSSIQQNPTIGGATTADAGFYSVYATESGCDGLPDSVEVVVTEPPVADAGGDQVACANNATITLNGSITGGTGAGVWTTSGNGSFSPSVNDLNADYVPSPADTAAGSITITLASINNAGCPASSDDMVLTITPSPAVEAGPDATICSNNAVVDLTGVVTAGATSGIWTSNGSGSFSPSDTDLGADYNATPADTAAGSFMIYLTSTNNGNCLAVSDSLEVTVIASPIADAGADQFVCDGDDVFLVGSITNGSGNGTWTTSGAGTFIPSATDLNATYEPDPTDYAIGSVVLTLTSTGSGSCLEEADSILITFTPPPTVNPGNDTTICSNEDLALSGLVSGATTTGIWSTSGDGSFSPSDTDLNAIYTPGPGDAAAGTITLTLTATNGCPSSAGIAVTITPGPTADAGPDQVLCATDDQVTLSGVIGGSTTTGEWSTTGDGSFTPTINALNGTYIIGLNDSISGSFDLILSSTNNGVCAAEMDTMSVTITTLPVVNAGIDTTICTNNLIDLYGLVSGGAGTGQWSTAGSGTFNPVSTDLNATYIPSPADITAGSVVLTLTSTGACAVVDDQLTMTITPGPEVDAGGDQTICETSIATLIGTLSGTAISAEWSTNGTGGFDPSITDLNADYIPSAADISAGAVEIYLTSTNNGLCMADIDTMVLTIGAGPIVDAGPDQGVCIGSNAPLSGSITGVTSTGQWSTLGDGSFTPNDTDLNGSYIPGVNDTTNGNVQLVLTSTNNAGCVADSDTLELTFETAPFIDAGPDVTVCGNADTVELAGLISGAITTGYWSTTGDGIFDSDTTILINTYYPGSLDSTGGGVQLLLYASGLSTCTPDPDTVNVTITAVPVVDAGGDQSICSSSLTVNLNGAVSGGSNSGIWTTDGSGVFAPDNTDLNGTYDPSTADTTAGSITMVLTSTNNGLCLAVSDSISVTFDDIPQANAGLDMTGCANDSLALSGVISGGGSSMWYTTNGNGTFSDSSALNAAYLPDSLDPSNSPIEIILEYTNGCGVDTDTLFADVYAVPVADFAFLQTCESDSIQFTDNSSVDVGSIISWNWDLGIGEVSSIINPTGYYDTLGNFTISLVVESDMGCTDSTSQSITVVPLPNADMWVSDTVVLPGDIIDFIDTSDYAVSWEWYFGDGSDSVQVEDTLYAYTNPGTYEVILVVENSQGCTDTAFQLITVESDSIADVFPPAFPTAFTPNGDGLNDVFYVRGGPFSEFELRIFNEWGNEIFTSNGQQIGWDGTKSGSPQPDGLYIYVFKGEGIDGEVYDISGEINIIR